MLAELERWTAAPATTRLLQARGDELVAESSATLDEIAELLTA